MTDLEWLACTDPAEMLDFLQDKTIFTDRKQRLFDCACVRRIWHLLRDKRGRRAVEVAERYADGKVAPEKLHEAKAIALVAADARATLALPGKPNSYIVLSAAAETAWEYRSGTDPLKLAAEAIAWENLNENGPPQRRLPKQKYAEERKVQAAFLRDIIGVLPFRTIGLDPAWVAWNDRTVVKLAQGIYEDRAFDQLPVLADALEDGGCELPTILDHLRGPGPHTRGCWAVDLLLAKE